MNLNLFNLYFSYSMPFGFSSLGFPLAVAVGAVAISGGVLYYYQKRRKPRENNFKSPISVEKSKNVGLLTQESLFKFVKGDNKMVFVVNRPLLNNKQNLFLTISTACLRCYEIAMKNKSNEPFMKFWLRSGQMKVVLKCQNSQELFNVSKKAIESNIPCVLLKASDVKCLSLDSKEKKKVSESLDDYIVVCLVGPATNLESITGHFKLL